MTTATTRYLTCAETAKLIRAALKDEFPGQKFSVRSHVYSMGASIDVDWTDGPNRQRVDEIVQHFSGASFDGMIDLKSYHTTEHNGEVVHMGADYVFANWNHSQEAQHAIEDVASPGEFQDDWEKNRDGFVGRVFWTPERYPVTAYRAGLIDAETAAKAGGWMRKDGTKDERGHDNYEYDVESFVAYAQRRMAA
jgi:hypothetical protein